ncbi:MAG: hypothetical protein M1822_002499 [Bathelium mastoideum]|nr:MAG: hypothetical protein M1822_002499 [Bathelium mastoideum]
MVWRLHMPAANRVAIVATLLTGILSFICGIFRLYINVKYNDNVVVDSGKVEYVLGVSSLDVIAMSTILLFWTQVEVGVANVAICLPTMRLGRLLTSKRSREILEKIRLSWLSSSKGGSSASKNRRSYIHPEDTPTSKLGGYRDRGGDELKEKMMIDAGTEGISKTVDFDVQTTAGYPLEAETDAAPRFESLHYPPRTAKKQYRPFEVV